MGVAPAKRSALPGRPASNTNAVAGDRMPGYAIRAPRGHGDNANGTLRVSTLASQTVTGKERKLFPVLDRMLRGNAEIRFHAGKMPGGEALPPGQCRPLERGGPEQSIMDQGDGAHGAACRSMAQRCARSVSELFRRKLRSVSVVSFGVVSFRASRWRGPAPSPAGSSSPRAATSPDGHRRPAGMSAARCLRPFRAQHRPRGACRLQPCDNKA